MTRVFADQPAIGPVSLKVDAMGLFARELGPADAPTILFLHGAERSGRSWQPVIELLPHYRCLFPDLPQHGESAQEGPFSIDRAATAVAELLQVNSGSGRVHLVAHSLGAQVGTQLLATKPHLFDRAVLCGTIINTLPGVWLTRRLLGAVAGISRSFEMSQSNREKTRPIGVASTEDGDDPDGVRLMPAGRYSEIVVASAGFTLPEGLETSASPTLVLTGAAEPGFVHESATALQRRMPNAVAGIARGARHNWPLRHPVIFARTIDGWLTGVALPDEIEMSPPVPNQPEPPQA
ncbi:alpha/beta hydrolase [Mycobacterium sp. ELW1]|nr:alpha/beta hydrolase [Mycobacterium sp. ELW1]